MRDKVARKMVKYVGYGGLTEEVREGVEFQFPIWGWQRKENVIPILSSFFKSNIKIVFQIRGGRSDFPIWGWKRLFS